MLSKSKRHGHLLGSGRIVRDGEGIADPRAQVSMREQVPMS